MIEASYIGFFVATGRSAAFESVILVTRFVATAIEASSRKKCC